jgi:hypothetical protein
MVAYNALCVMQVAVLLVLHLELLRHVNAQNTDTCGTPTAVHVRLPGVQLSSAKTTVWDAVRVIPETTDMPVS